MTAARIAAAIVATTVGVLMLSPTLAGATCGHPGQPEWCPALPTTTTTATTATSTTTTSTVAPTTTVAVDAVVVDIGDAIHIERSVGATPVPVAKPKFAG
jgi:hypothetical protein